MFRLWMTGTILIILILTSSPALAHVPIQSGENHDIAAATSIEDPGKSWVTYSEIHSGGGTAYYELHMEKQSRVVASLFVPEKTSFAPSLFLIGPGLPTNGTPPGPIGMPVGDGFLMVEGRYGEPSYEPFTPSAQYEIAQMDIDVPAKDHYYLVVYSEKVGGKFGLAIGYREEFTAQEWLSVPNDLRNIYIWQGQAPILVYLPEVLALAVGIGIGVWYSKRKGKMYRLHQWLGLAGGSMILGSGIGLLYQMGRALSLSPSGSAASVVTVMFALGAIGLGLWAIKISQRIGPVLSRMNRVWLGVVAGLAVFIWAGFYFGPVLLLAAALFPVKRDGASPRKTKRSDEEE